MFGSFTEPFIYLKQSDTISWAAGRVSAVIRLVKTQCWYTGGAVVATSSSSSSS